MFCRSLFVLLYFFVWSLCSLFFFDLRILIITLVSSNSSCHTLIFSTHHVSECDRLWVTDDARRVYLTTFSIGIAACYVERTQLVLGTGRKPVPLVWRMICSLHVKDNVHMATVGWGITAILYRPDHAMVWMSSSPTNVWARGYGLWCLTPLSNNISVISWRSI